MKKLILIASLLIVGCSDDPEFERLAALNLRGVCKDLENPSIYKERSAYEVAGTFEIIKGYGDGVFNLNKNNLENLKKLTSFEIRKIS